MPVSFVSGSPTLLSACPPSFGDEGAGSLLTKDPPCLSIPKPQPRQTNNTFSIARLIESAIIMFATQRCVMANVMIASQAAGKAKVIRLADYRKITREIPPPSIDYEVVENSLLAIDTLLKTARNMIEKLRAEVRHG